MDSCYYSFEPDCKELYFKMDNLNTTRIRQ